MIITAAIANYPWSISANGSGMSWDQTTLGSVIAVAKSDTTAVSTANQISSIIQALPKSFIAIVNDF